MKRIEAEAFCNKHGFGKPKRVFHDWIVMEPDEHNNLVHFMKISKSEKRLGTAYNIAGHFEYKVENDILVPMNLIVYLHKILGCVCMDIQVQNKLYDRIERNVNRLNIYGKIGRRSYIGYSKAEAVQCYSNECKALGF